MSDTTVGLLHPGQMGAAVGQCLTAAGHRVLWVPAGRSPASAARAASAGLAATGGAAELARSADVIMSVVPPHAAAAVARKVAAAGFGGLYVDANAVAPGTVRKIARIVVEADFVDGGIIGTPPVAPGFIRLYLSGARARQVQDLFEGTPVRTIVIDQPSGAGGDGADGQDGIGLASAAKMAYASWTKGSAALLLTARALARAEGVEGVLLTEWGLSQPGLDQRSARAAGSAAAKGWRWVAEMEEIAAAMGAAGLPDGFHRAAAEIYRRSRHSPGAALDDVLAVLAGDSGDRSELRDFPERTRVLASEMARRQQGPRRSVR